ncbi:chalcone isomerase-like protein [Roseateles toxinivorans]|uniref:Chalcone isomerase-like protein n=2 Tax=Roseateles toxinivorans TaxID=270368 RepID=A0A4R6QLS5_9BURK|nr:chalcone isomerase family protein [Roseateles toxinivorans]TDP63818.1 chalcone isomerase-like protein [Roseateles toxinivorans]
MKPLLKTLSLVLMSMVLASSAWSAPVDVYGVKFDEQVEMRGSNLLLNGAGTRFKGPFKVYAAGLYLGKKVSTPDEVVALPGPKRLSITMLRGIDAAELGKLLTRGMEDNMGKAAMAPLIPGLIRLGQMFADHKNLVAGDSFTVEWIPGTGTVLTVKGKVQGEPFKEPEFFKALMWIWMGPVPADWKLKDQLLGLK